MAKKAYGKNRKGKKRLLRNAGKKPKLHCMLIPAEKETLLLPTSIIAEVVDYETPEAMEATPPWLLGQAEWDNRQVPVFSFSALINGTDVGEVPEHSKILILKSLSDSARMPFLGLLLSDLPRSVRIADSSLVETGDEKKSLGVYSRITLDEQDAIIPDIDRLTHLVTHATFGALPITQLED